MDGRARDLIKTFSGRKCARGRADEGGWVSSVPGEKLRLLSHHRTSVSVLMERKDEVPPSTKLFATAR